MKRENAYKYIKDRIMDHTWSADTAINVNEVCQALNMSRTPVLEAISRLEKEGFLSVVPQVGAFVRRPNRKELFERLMVRGALETLLVEWAVRNINPSQLEALETTLKQMEEPGLSISQYAEFNRRFHQLIYEASQLSYVRKLAEEHWDYWEYASSYTTLFEGLQMSQSLFEHQIIFYAMKQRNAALAKQLMEQHVVRVVNLMREKED